MLNFFPHWNSLGPEIPGPGSHRVGQRPSVHVYRALTLCLFSGALWASACSLKIWVLVGRDVHVQKEGWFRCFSSATCSLAEKVPTIAHLCLCVFEGLLSTSLLCYLLKTCKQNSSLDVCFARKHNLWDVSLLLTPPFSWQYYFIR